MTSACPPDILAEQRYPLEFAIQTLSYLKKRLYTGNVNKPYCQYRQRFISCE